MCSRTDLFRRGGCVHMQCIPPKFNDEREPYSAPGPWSAAAQRFRTAGWNEPSRRLATSSDSLAAKGSKRGPQASRDVDAEAGGSAAVGRRLSLRQSTNCQVSSRCRAPPSQGSQLASAETASCFMHSTGFTPFETHFSPPLGRPRMLFQPVGQFCTVPSVMAPANMTPGYHVHGALLAAAFVSSPIS